MSEGPQFTRDIEDENPRYISEWDYWAQERNRDFDEFHAEAVGSTHYANIVEGKLYRDSQIISGRTADIALIPYRDAASHMSYVFVLSWHDLIMQGDIRPDDVGDETLPYMEFRLTEDGKEDEILLADKMETIHDLQGYLTREIASNTASEIVLNFFSEIVYDLERGSRVWKFEPRTRAEVFLDEQNKYC